MRKSCTPDKLAKRFIIRLLCIPSLLVVAFSLSTISKAGSLHSQEALLSTSVSVTVENKNIRNIFSALERAANIKFSYSSAILPKSKISLSSKDEKLKVVLERLLDPLRIEYYVSGRYIILTKQGTHEKEKIETTTGSSQSMYEKQEVTGKVTDGSGNPLPGVTIFVKGTQQGTISNIDGIFNITVSESLAVLVFSYIGYATQETAVGNSTRLDIVMQNDNRILNEVIVVGYGTQKKSQLTGAISSVGAKEISEMPITNLGQALQGRAAGVDVAQLGSRPGSVPKILIRGRRSFNAGNEPLYVVDGIPLAEGYEDMNPNDVQSMEVLKDATATGIYGARGANGIVLITTKRGQGTQKKTTISYDTYIGVSKALDKVKLFNGSEFAEFVREASRATGNYKDANGNPVATGTVDEYADSKLEILAGDPAVAKGLKNGTNTDWQDLILQNGFIQNHSLGVQGGNEKTKFYLSGGFFRDKGIVKNLDFTRLSLRSNIDTKINNWLNIGLSTYLMNSIRNGENLNTYGMTIQQNPLASPYDDNGDIIFTPTNDPLLTNPLSELVSGVQVDETKRYRIFNSLYTEFNVTKYLKYRVNFGPDITIGRSGRFVGSITNARKGGDPQAGVSNSLAFNWTLENIVNYERTFKGSHHFNLTLLHSIQRDNYEFYNIQVQGVPVESQQFYNLGDASTVLTPGSALREWTINSVMGRLNYDFNDKYLLTMTIRRDGSSRFGENSKYGNFPGLALGWNLTNEKFLNSVHWLDLLKLRAGWGKVGNQGVAPYQTQGLLGRTQYAWGATPAYGYQPNTIGNPNLRWESSATVNLGVDFSLFRGRIQGSLELYKTNTKDLLLSDQIPGSTGFTAVTRNVGQTSNKGIELGISSVNMDHPSGFKWTTDLTFTKNKEEIVSLYNGKVNDEGNGWFIGRPLSTAFDYKKEGIWQQKEEALAKSYGSLVGQIKVQDTNQDGIINADDRLIIGSDVPDFSSGITNRFSYKGFDLSFFLFARIGSLILSEFHKTNNQLAGRFEQIKVDYWTPKNPTNAYPQPLSTQGNPVYNSTLHYFDGSFVKLRNINFGYTFNSASIKALKMQSLKVYTSIQQPVIWSSFRSKHNGVDPETTSLSTGGKDVTPATSVFTIGINAKF